MVSLRASLERNWTPSAPLSQSTLTPFSPAAESDSQAIVFAHETRRVLGAVLVYVVLVIATVLTLHPYFSQSWDVVTFVNAGKSILSPDWTMLYTLSRADRFWPYAYPPLHALVVAPFIALAGPLPNYLAVRLPPLLFDVALGILLYAITARQTRNKQLARLALWVWLLNPVTWYDTAVQGHFEAEWLFFVILAYALAGNLITTPSVAKREGWVLPTLALSIAFLFKQNAILFAMPFWAHLFFNRGTEGVVRRLLRLGASMLIYAVPILLVSLPFLLASNDYWFMNVQYVADVPLQTQSWLVALATAFGSDAFILRASSLLTLAAAALISIFAARRKVGLWLIGLFIVLAFFLLSKKVVGYYYVMVLPFAILTLVPTKHFRLLSLILVTAAFISLAPYFASWTEPDHAWFYAVMGTIHSALWLGIFLWLWRKQPLAVAFAQNQRAPLFISLALCFTAGVAALLQPFIQSQTSPIRSPLIAPGLEAQTGMVFLMFAVLASIATLIAVVWTRFGARTFPIPAGAYVVVVLLAPLFFVTFTLTKESTAALELVLNMWRR